MKRALIARIPHPHQAIEIPEVEAHHLIQVLRLRHGDLIEVLDGQGGAGIARLEVRGKKVFAHGVERELAASIPLPTSAQIVPLTLEVSILKGDAMEWCIEKSVELGVIRFVPLITERTVIRLDKKGPEFFQERWQRIADQALKQCGRLRRMEISLPLPLDMRLTEAREELTQQTVTSARLFANERIATEDAHSLGRILEPRRLQALSLMIGPEGGWSDLEVQALQREAQDFNLGPLILRAETAVLACAAIAGQYLPRQ